MNELYATLMSSMPHIPMWVFIVVSIAAVSTFIMLDGSKHQGAALAGVIAAAGVLAAAGGVNVWWEYRHEGDLARAAASYVLDSEGVVPVEKAAVDLGERTMFFRAAESDGDVVYVTVAWLEPIVAGEGDADQLVSVTIDDEASEEFLDAQGDGALFAESDDWPLGRH